MSFIKHSDNKKKKAAEDYRAKHGYDPTPDQLSNFMTTWIATDGYGSGAVSGGYDSSSSYSDTSSSSGCDTSSSSGDGGASASGSCDVSGGAF